MWFPDESDNSVQTLQRNHLPFGLMTSPFAVACVLKFHIRKFKDHYPDYCEMLGFMHVDDGMAPGYSASWVLSFNCTPIPLKNYEKGKKYVYKR